MQIEDWVKDGSGLTVQAVRLNEDNAAAVAEWCGGALIQEIDPEHPDENQPGINVPTRTGTQRASLGMYVIKFGKLFFVSYVRVFEARYHPADRPAPHPESNGDSMKARGFADPFAPPGRM